jgi:hypothetical protein
MKKLLILLTILLFSFTARADFMSDFNGDNVVDEIDLAEISNYWLTSDYWCDLNEDGIVNFQDFAIMGNEWKVVDANIDVAAGDFSAIGLYALTETPTETGDLMYGYIDPSLAIIYYPSMDGNDMGLGYEGTGKWSIVAIFYILEGYQIPMFVQQINIENYVNFINPDYGTGSVIIRGIRQEVIP